MILSLHLKRTLRAVLFILLLSLVGKVNAQDFSDGSLNYTINSDGASVERRAAAGGSAVSCVVDTHITYSVAWLESHLHRVQVGAGGR